jgi:hypothetical protein
MAVWKGRNITHAGKTYPYKDGAFLSSDAHASRPQRPKCVLQYLDKIRKRFLTDRLLFATATRVTIGDGAKTSFFYHSAWAYDRRPRDIAPKVFAASGRRKFDNQGSDSSSWMGEKYHPACHLVNRPLEPVR